MEGQAGTGGLVPSINPPNQVETWGFDHADDAAHMILWLGRGPDFRRFVVNDIESELYRQTPGAQLLKVTCNAGPELRTTVRQSDSVHGSIVTGLNVTFPVTVQVRTADGAIWKLDIKHNYDATNIHLRDNHRQIRLNFTITAHIQEGVS
jgi:hypothetical protein